MLCLLFIYNNLAPLYTYIYIILEYTGSAYLHPYTDWERKSLSSCESPTPLENFTSSLWQQLPLLHFSLFLTRLSHFQR